MQDIRLPPGMSLIIQIRNISALKGLDHGVIIDRLVKTLKENPDEASTLRNHSVETPTKSTGRYRVRAGATWAMIATKAKTQ